MEEVIDSRPCNSLNLSRACEKCGGRWPLGSWSVNLYCCRCGVFESAANLKWNYGRISELSRTSEVVYTKPLTFAKQPWSLGDERGACSTHYLKSPAVSSHANPLCQLTHKTGLANKRQGWLGLDFVHQ